MSKIFNFFSGSENKHDLGVTKAQVKREKSMGFGFFFRLFKNRLRNLSSTSILFSLCNFPIFLFLFGISGNLNSSAVTPSMPMYAQLYGLELAGARSPLLASLYGIFGQSTTISIASMASKVLMYSAFLLVLTLGVSTLGAIYNVRAVVRCEPLSPWSEFFSAIKRNWKQGLLFSVIDAALIAFFGYDLLYYSSQAGNMLLSMFFYVVLFAALIYFVMRYFIYLQILTFDMKLKRILKNALYMTFLGWKRSLVCMLSTLCVFVVSIYLYVLFPSVGILLPFVVTFGLLLYIGAYCTYPVIEKYIIDPYYKEHPEELPEEDDVEAIFTDRG